MKGKMIRQTIRLSEEDIDRLEMIAKEKYRVFQGRSLTIRLMIEDMWREVKNDGLSTKS